MRAIKILLSSLVAATVIGTGAPAVGATDLDVTPAPAGAEVVGQLAEYEGRIIDMSKSWEGATICVEQVESGFRCYADEATYRKAAGLPAPESGVGIAARNDCPNNYYCLWDNREYAGKRAQLYSSGQHALAPYGLKNRANSVYNNRLGISYGWDETCSSEYLYRDARQYHPELSTWPRQYCSGSWNNKLTSVELR